MTIAHIALRSLRQHALSTAVTAVSIALAIGLLMSVWVIKEEANANFTRVNAGFDAVLGPRSSDLQLVLNSIFHLETSPGNIPWSEFLNIEKHPSVARAVPIAVGDSFLGYRVVGTTLEMFRQEQTAGGSQLRLKTGRVFDPALREAVVGSFVADRLKLEPGDEFHPAHGVASAEQADHPEAYVVIGILKPSNTPADRVIWIPLEGLQKMTGHRAEAQAEISAVLIRFHGAAAIKMLQQKYNASGGAYTLAGPVGSIVAQLLQKLSWVDRVLQLIALLVVFIAAGTVLASIYNSINERRREFAILRALGARRTLVFLTIIVESAATAALGAVASFAIYIAIMTGVAHVIRSQTGVVLDWAAWHPVLLWAPAGVIALASLVGIVPAFKAYGIEVADQLSPA